MTKGFTDQEFAKYVEQLEFQNLEDLCVFIRSYYDDYLRKQDSDSFLKYSILMTKHGEMFLRFMEAVLALKKEGK